MRLKALVTTALLAAVCSPAMASTVFFDNFSGAQPNLATQTFNTGATTGFRFWPIGTSGNMDAGRFSVVTSANQIHSSFVGTLDADNSATGKYAVYNGFSNAEGLAYRIVLNNLVAGQTYTFSSALLALTTNAFPQISSLMFRANGVDLVPDSVVTPQPANQGVWGVVTRSFVAAAGSNTLDIVNLGSASNAGNDFGIDNVTVAAAIPLPASALMGVSTLAVATLRRRR